MSVIIRTFLIALLFAAIIFILGANNIFSIKDDVVDFSIEKTSRVKEISSKQNKDAFSKSHHQIIES